MKEPIFYCNSCILCRSDRDILFVYLVHALFISWHSPTSYSFYFLYHNIQSTLFMNNLKYRNSGSTKHRSLSIHLDQVPHHVLLGAMLQFGHLLLYLVLKNFYQSSALYLALYKYRAEMVSFAKGRCHFIHVKF